MEQNQPLLTISLLASNRADTIRRCLDSLRPIMEQLPCELILVDTGTDEKVHAILREYTDQVIPFRWCDDFAKARNAGLSQAKGEWFLYLDDDEWFVETEELIRFFRSGEYRNYGYANYIVRNFLDPEYSNYSDSWGFRMIRLAADTHFESRIHEYLHPTHGAGKNLHAVANHSGYIYATEADRRKRFERNARLIREMMEEEPENLRWRVQLAQEYYAIGEWEALTDLCGETLRLLRDAVRESQTRLLATFYAGAAEGRIGQRQYDAALHVIGEALADKRCTPLGKAYVRLTESVVHFYQKDWLSSQRSLAQYFTYQKAIETEEASYIRWQEALIADAAFDAISQKKAYSIAIGAGLMLGQQEVLEQYFPRLEWDKRAVYVFPGLLPVLFEALLTIPEQPVYANVWLCIWGNPVLYDCLQQELWQVWECYTKEQRAEWCGRYEARTMAFLRIYYQEPVLDQLPEFLPEPAQRALRLRDTMREKCKGEKDEWQKNN